MAKLPYFPFYTGDWLKDTRHLSLAAKGALIDIMCAAHDSSTRGVVTFSMVQIARYVSCQVDQARQAMDELTDDKNPTGKSILNRRDEGDLVTLTSRRMVRDEHERNQTRKRVQRHRNADVTLDVTQVKRPCTEDDNEDDVTSSSGKGGVGENRAGIAPGMVVSSGESGLPRIEGQAQLSPSPESAAFERFWNAYPNGSHKPPGARYQSERMWTTVDATPAIEAVLASLAAWKRSENWRKENGKFIPKPITWLRDQQWLAPPPGVKVVAVLTDVEREANRKRAEENTRRAEEQAERDLERRRKSGGGQ